MTARVIDILNNLELKAPFQLAESWDNVGLLIGNPEQHVTGVIAGLDPTNELIDEAINSNCNTIITHHPIIFKPLASINTGTPEGKLLQKILSHNIAVIGCHTNFDSAEEGVSDVLGQRLGLNNLAPLITPSGAPTGTGLGRIGSYEAGLTAAAFTKRLLAALELEGVQVTGPIPEIITTVAVCGGSGSDFAKTAFQQGADVYISAEIKHSTAIWARENEFCIIDGTHYATEKPAVALLVKRLLQANKTEGWNTKVQQSVNEKHPFVYIDINHQHQ
ncbi:MAG: dinuclear metal center YbgI/SA1388 family protein [Desulforhopalus sp.]|jgi:dinuclear metal center YbgI/SA1388 family protein